jgi:hypothetical protein
MSSHREAPEISKDPVADNTDLYAFVTPNKPSTVTIIANFIPLQDPDAGPNFFEFGDDVSYKINISNHGDAADDISFVFKFTTQVRNDNTFLYNTGQIKHITDTTWNRPQTYDVSLYKRGGYRRVLARGLTVPPCNVGSRSTPNYSALASQAVHTMSDGIRVFAGQRADAFHVDLGSIFDLGTLRPFASHHLIPSAAGAGVDGLQGKNVHSIAIEVPISHLTRDGSRPQNPMLSHATIGIWASAERRRMKIQGLAGKVSWAGPPVQVSRLGNPLFNEVITPMAYKDAWNYASPTFDRNFAKYVLKPELAGLLPVLYPGVFPNLAAYTKPRADLAAILLTGIPAGIVPGFQNFTGTVQADMLRLNVAIKPSRKPNPIGLLAGDAAGFPNGRRPNDDVVAIELRAIAGLTIPLVDKSFTPDGATAGLSDGTKNTNIAVMPIFPYLGTPSGGSEYKPGTPKTA